MSMGRSIATALAMVLFAAPLWAQAQSPQQAFSVPSAATGIRSPEVLSSPVAAARFLELGYELAQVPNITGPEVDQAIILLTTAKTVNKQAIGVEPLLLKLATRRSEKNYSEPMIFWLQQYVDGSADRVIVADAVRYLLGRANTREERKALLERIAPKIRNKNPAIDSELATSLGLLMLELQQTEQAKFYLVQAYNSNKFNRTAFAKLAEVAPNEMTPATQLEHLRLLVRENPLDLNGALAFAAYAERLQLYDVAAPSYQYCAELFRYLYPTEPLPANIYLPWAINCYNTVQGRPICMQIAENIRTLGHFDILLEAIAGKAAVKLGRADEARQIFKEAAQKAQEVLSGQGVAAAAPGAGPGAVRPVNAKQMAWFYCFADPNVAAALDWANRAYSAEPNSPPACALLAYALAMNGRLELAKPLLVSAEKSQIGDLVQARVQLAAGDRPGAVQTLKNGIAKDAGSLAAEKARDFLRELGGEYTPPVATRPLVSFLAERLGRAMIPQFTPPDKMMDVQFTVRGGDFSYGNEIEGVITIANKGPEPLVITENSLFQGNVRVSARVSGSLTRDIPNLVFETIRTDLVVPTGKSLVHKLRLSTGELRDLLVTCPQAALDLQFTLYLDPVTTDLGQTNNRLVDLKPITVAVRRPPVAITDDMVRSRLGVLASGSEGQKAQAALWFTGMLKEQQLMREKGVLYAFQYRDSLPAQLRLSLTSPSGLLLGPADREWAVRVCAMADMLSLPLDQELAAAVAKNLTHPYWPVRMMAVYLLSKSTAGTFDNVLDWVAKNDAEDLVRSMAVSLLSGSSATIAPQI